MGFPSAVRRAHRSARWEREQSMSPSLLRRQDLHQRAHSQDGGRLLAGASPPTQRTHLLQPLQLNQLSQLSQLTQLSQCIPCVPPFAQQGNQGEDGLVRGMDGMVPELEGEAPPTYAFTVGSVDSNDRVEASMEGARWANASRSALLAEEGARRPRDSVELTKSTFAARSKTPSRYSRLLTWNTNAYLINVENAL